MGKNEAATQGTQAPVEAHPTGVITAQMLGEALAIAMKQSSPSAQLLTGLSQDKIDQAMGKFDQPIKRRIIRGRSQATGATFDMVVLSSRKHPNGRVVQLENYRVPDSAYVPESQGGKLPNGSRVWRDEKAQGKLGQDTPTSMLTMQFKQTITEMYWRPDLQNVANGHPLLPWNCVDPADIDAVPWEETKLFSDRE